MEWAGANAAVPGAFLTMFTLQTGFRAFQHEGAHSRLKSRTWRTVSGFRVDSSGSLPQESEEFYHAQIGSSPSRRCVCAEVLSRTCSMRSTTQRRRKPATDNLFSQVEVKKKDGAPTVFMDPRRAMIGVRLKLGR